MVFGENVEKGNILVDIGDILQSVVHILCSFW